MNPAHAALVLFLAFAPLSGLAAPRVLVDTGAVKNEPKTDAKSEVKIEPPAVLRPAASMEEIRIESHGATMNGLLYLPAGPGPHPVVVFLHGYPGNERNLDIAQAVRRAGYAAVYFDYRGAFGSGGTFTFVHSLEDAATVLAWIRTQKMASKYRLDPTRIAVFGHSFGGWLALTSIAHEAPGVCVATPAAWNPGWVVKRFGAHPKELDEMLAYYQRTTNASSGPMKADAYSLIRDMHDHAQQWDYTSQAAALKDHAVLLVAGTADTPDEGVERETQLADAIRAKGGKQVQMVTFEDDESFSSHRLALADTLIQWLRTACAKAQAGEASPQ